MHRAGHGAAASSIPSLPKSRSAGCATRASMLHENSSSSPSTRAARGSVSTSAPGDEASSLDASHILVAAGRVANLGELELDAAKIRRAKTDPGALALTPALRTTNPRVYAVGEAAGHAPAAASRGARGRSRRRARRCSASRVRYDPASGAAADADRSADRRNRAQRADGARAASRPALPCCAPATPKTTPPAPPATAWASSS